MQRWIFKAQKDEVFVFNEDKFREVLLSLPKGPYWLKLERITAKRSLPQNKLYHKWVGIIAESLGYLEPEDACRALKIRLGLCHTEKDKITKGERWICPSTADFNVPDMSEWMTKVEMFAASELNITLPAPEDIP